MALRKRTQSYWEKRTIERVALLELQAAPYVKQLNSIYADARNDMLKQIKSIYASYYTSKGWDTQTLNSLAPTGDLNQFKQQLRASGLETKLPARYKGRLTRAELMYAQMWQNSKNVYTKELALSNGVYPQTYKNSYNLSVYTVSKGLTATPVFTKLPQTQIDAVLRHKFMGKNYSARIWGNTNLLAADLQRVIAKTIITGAPLNRSAKELRERYGVAKYRAERLMRTETSRFQNEGTQDAHESMGFDNWRWDATLDSRTDIDCGERENHIYSYSAGDQIPPLHVNCRCAQVPYLPASLAPSIRIARGKDGKNYYTANMSYEQWADAYL